MLQIKNLLKYYGDTLALSIDDVQFSTGLYWIKGENGSGKTTLFKSLAGLLPCKGSVAFEDGVSLHAHPVEYRKLVNYSEAEPAFPGFLTAKELFRFIGKARQSSHEQQQEVLQLFGIDAYWDKPCEAYSSGMLKKVSLALALLGSPRLIILDEPLITLDEHARSILQQHMHTLIEKQQVTFLVSSHQTLESDMIRVNATYTVQHKTLRRA